MTDLILPDPRMEMPELFEPGRKPTGPVAIDWSQTPGGALGFFALAGNDKSRLVNLVSGEILDPLTSGNEYSTDYGQQNIRVGTSGGYLLDRFIGADDYTVIGVVRLPADGSAYRNFFRCSTIEAQHHLLIDPSGFIGVYKAGLYTSGFDTSALTPGIYTVVAVGRLATNQTKIFINGVHVGTAGRAMTIPISDVFAGDNGIQGINTNCYAAGIFDDALSDVEASSLSRNPYQFLIPA